MTSATPPKLEDPPAEASAATQAVASGSTRQSPDDPPDPLGEVGPAASPRSSSTSAAPARKAKGRVMKIIRRTHLYTGLLLLPWVLFFGISGFLFNHEDLLRSQPSETVTHFSQAQLQQNLGFAQVDATAIAGQIIDKLNASAGQEGSLFTLTSEANLQGVLTYNATSPGQRHTLTLDLNRGQAWIATAPAREDDGEAQRTSPPFAGQRVKLPELPMDGLAGKIDSLASGSGVEADGRWASRSRTGPEIRFSMDDEAGRRWHVTYDVARSTLAGRAADEPPALTFAQTVAKLHKLHHYPAELGPRFIWMIAADATALTMIFWGLSGLIMWWQLKPTRTIGIAALSVCAVVGFLIFMSVLADVNFDAPAERGRRSPAAAMAPQP